MTFKVFFAIATFFDLNINQMNIKSVFLYKFINQLIYIKISKNKKNQGKLKNVMQTFENTLWPQTIIQPLVQKTYIFFPPKTRVNKNQC